LNPAAAIREDVLRRLAALIVCCNGSRRVRIIAPGQAARCVVAVIGGLPFFCEHAGLVGLESPERAVTTVFLAARVAGRVHFSASTFNAMADDWSPGRSWPMLRPFRTSGPAGDAAAKWAAWAASPGVVELSCEEVDALHEGEGGWG
jgi:hypothetical protein